MISCSPPSFSHSLKSTFCNFQSFLPRYERSLKIPVSMPIAHILHKNSNYHFQRFFQVPGKICKIGKDGVDVLFSTKAEAVRLIIIMTERHRYVYCQCLLVYNERRIDPRLVSRAFTRHNRAVSSTRGRNINC